MKKEKAIKIALARVVNKLFLFRARIQFSSDLLIADTIKKIQFLKLNVLYLLILHGDQT